MITYIPASNDRAEVRQEIIQDVSGTKMETDAGVKCTYGSVGNDVVHCEFDHRTIAWDHKFLPVNNDEVILQDSVVEVDETRSDVENIFLEASNGITENHWGESFQGRSRIVTTNNALRIMQEQYTGSPFEIETNPKGRSISCFDMN